jgi:hypothetical protein
MISRFFSRFIRALSALAFVALLSGCFYPEKFTLDVDFQEDGAVNLTYEGTIFSHDALTHMRVSKKTLTAQEDESMVKIAEILAKRPEFRSAKYIGNGRFQIKAQRSAHKGQLLTDMPIFGVFRDLEQNTDLVMQTGMNVEPVYKSLGLSPEGVIRISLPDNAKVVSSTTEASRSMVFFGKRTYTWNYKRGAEAKMRLRF